MTPKNSKAEKVNMCKNVNMYKCENCGLVVKRIPNWKKGECPSDEHQHYFEKIGNSIGNNLGNEIGNSITLKQLRKKLHARMEVLEEEYNRAVDYMVRKIKKVSASDFYRPIQLLSEIKTIRKLCAELTKHDECIKAVGGD